MERIQQVANVLQQGNVKLVELCKGHPGAAVAVRAMVESYARFDPACVLPAELAVLAFLENTGLKGGQVHALFKDVCETDEFKFAILMRATQLGFVAAPRIYDYVVSMDTSKQFPMRFDWQHLLGRIQKQIDSFAFREPVVEHAQVQAKDTVKKEAKRHEQG